MSKQDVSVVIDSRMKVGKKHKSELKLKGSRMNMTVILWGDTEEELDRKVTEFLTPLEQK